MRRAGYDPRHGRAPRRRATVRATRRRPMSARVRLGIPLPVLTLAAAGFAACPLSRPATPPPSPPPPRPPRPRAPPPPPRGGRGKAVYDRQCAACHGTGGRGDGEAAYLLYPKPRDFTTGNYRLVSTWERVPTDEDLYLTISRGMPGSAMPSWGHLPEEERWALVHYIKSFAAKPWPP